MKSSMDAKDPNTAVGTAMTFLEGGTTHACYGATEAAGGIGGGRVWVEAMQRGLFALDPTTKVRTRIYMEKMKSPAKLDDCSLRNTLPTSVWWIIMRPLWPSWRKWRIS